MICGRYLIFSLCFLVVMVWRYDANAQTPINDVMTKLTTAANDTNKINLYKEAITYYKRKKLDTALEIVDDGIKLAKKISSPAAEAYMFLQKGYICRELGRLSEAKSVLDSALAISTATGDKKRSASIKNEIGVIEGTQADYSEATRCFLEAMKLYEEIKDTLGIGQTYIKLGVINEKLNNLDKAKECYRKAFVLSSSKKDSINMAYLYNNMGIVEGKLEKIPLAISYFDSGLAICRSEKFTNIKLGLLLNSGIAHAHAGNEDKALRLFNEGLVLARERSMPYDVPNLLLNIALLDHATPADRKIPILKEALQLARESGQKSLQVSIYQTMADAYFDQGEYKEAYLYQDTCNKLEKSIYTKEKDKEIANLQTSYELEKSHIKVAQLTQQNMERNRQRNAIIVIACMAVAALITVFLSYRRSKALNTELKKQGEELANTSQVKDKIFSIIGHDLRSPTTTIIGMLHVLTNEEDNITHEERKEIYTMLAEHSQASLDTLNKLLLWGSKEIKGISIQQENCNARKYIEANTRLLADRLTEKKLELKNTVSPDTCVHVDESHFDFIVRNLLANAIKYSYNGGTITIGTLAQAEKGTVTFYVQDNGIGISAELGNTIFQLNSESRRGTGNEKGTGLGLVLCKEFIEHNGGKIWVESEEGKGATFYFQVKEGKC